MAIVIALGIAIAAAAFVAAPLFFGTGRTARAAGDRQTSPELEDLLAEKETLYAAIQELDFDLKSGKLSEKDHRLLRERHEARAASLLQQIDALERPGPEEPRKGRREKRKA